MKLVIATPLYPPDIGGPATPTPFLPHAPPAPGGGVETVPWSSVGAWSKGVRHALYTLRLLRAARRADALLAQDTVSVGLPALLAARLAHVPLLGRVAGDPAWGPA